MMPQAAIAAVLLLAVGAFAGAPQPTSQYYVEFVFQMPENPSVQEPVAVWYDGVHGNEVISYYGGMDLNVFLTVGGKQKAYQVNPTGSSPSKTSTACATNGVNLSPFMFSAFPSSLESFTLAGQSMVNGVLCDMWTFNDTQAGQATSNYTYFVNAETQAPVRYEYIGLLGQSGGSAGEVGFLNSPNYDWFVVEYTTYIANYYNASVFVVPEICKSARKGSVATPRQVAHRFGVSVPSDELFDEYKALHGKRYKGAKEHALRKSHFMANVDLVHRLNLDANDGAVYAINHLADRSADELRMRRMPAHKATGKLPAGAIEHVKRTKSLAELPSAFDWRAKGFDATAFEHEQGDCGSCWTFGAAGAFSGAVFAKHGVNVDFSKQVLMDCSWDEGNQACNGGTPGRAYKTIEKLGGWPLEADYPYLMNDGVCHKFSANYTIAKGVDVTPLDKHALLDALVAYGPIAVAVDASPVAWNFYHAGVYSPTAKQCNPASLDHEVLLVGYTTDAFIIQNSWSQYWGAEGGFIYLGASGNTCGVLSEPQYAIPN